MPGWLLGGCGPAGWEAQTACVGFRREEKREGRLASQPLCILAPTPDCGWLCARASRSGIPMGEARRESTTRLGLAGVRGGRPAHRAVSQKVVGVFSALRTCRQPRDQGVQGARA